MRGLLDWAQKNKSRLSQQKVGSSKGTQTAARWCRRPSCCRRGRSPPPSLTRRWRSTPPSRQQRCCCESRTKARRKILEGRTWTCNLWFRMHSLGSWGSWTSTRRGGDRCQPGRWPRQSYNGWNVCTRDGFCTSDDTPLVYLPLGECPAGCCPPASRRRGRRCCCTSPPGSWTTTRWKSKTVSSLK